MQHINMIILVISCVLVTLSSTYVYWELANSAFLRWQNLFTTGGDIFNPECFKNATTANCDINTLERIGFAQQLLKKAMNLSNSVFEAMPSLPPYPSKPLTKIISYGLYGGANRYIDGAHANVELASKIYPGWKMRVYHDKSVPEETLKYLRDHDVDLVDMSDDPIRNKMTWRFLPAGESDVDVFISRDIDSRLSPREYRAVREWEDSNLTFHVLRDHPSHSRFPVSGGMWGSKANALPEIRQQLLRGALSDSYLDDMKFLNDQIWPLMQKRGVMVHDAFNCDRLNTRPFPSPRIGTEHVGSVYIDGRVRQIDAELLQKAIDDGQPHC